MKKLIACLLLTFSIVIIGASCYAEAANMNEVVYVAEHGAKYHKDPGCSNMKNPIEITLGKALNLNYTACKKCAGGE